MEQIIKFGQNPSLVGVLTEGDDRLRKNFCVIISNSGLIHKPGPNRISVRIARQLASKGIHAFRFDFSGMGDSPLAERVQDSVRSNITEIRWAMDRITALTGITSFALYGLCSAAEVSFKASLEDERVAGLILVDGYYQTPELLERLLPAASRKCNIRYYRKHLLDYRRWIKVLTGNSRAVSFEKLLGRFRRQVKPDAENSGHVGGGPVVDTGIDKWEALFARGVNAQLIYSEGSHYVDLYHQSLGPALKRFRKKKLVEYRMIGNADHTFTPVWSQQRLADLVCHWAQRLTVAALLVFSFLLTGVLTARAADSTLDKRIDTYVRQTMQEAHIPGMSLVLVDSGRTVVRCYGVTDLVTGAPVTPGTLFQLGSCSKAFTALAVLDLAQRGQLCLDDPITHYIPWLHLRYGQHEVEVTLRELLHHTSGIPWTSISKIPPDSGRDALEHTVRQLDGQSLSALPGKRYEYATINYDILALVIQRVSGISFESYVAQRILTPLGLTATTVGAPLDSNRLASGYKVGFFRPRAYRAPVFGGNDAAGYVISDAADFARWLRFQMGLDSNGLSPLARATQQRDETVALHDMSSYAMGWDVSLDGTGQISHSGQNPNYTAYVGFRPNSGCGVAVLANSNSNYTAVIGGNVLKLLAGESIPKEFKADDGADRSLSMIALLSAGYLLVVLGFLVTVLLDIFKGRRVYQPFTSARMKHFGLAVLALAPLGYGLYLLPGAMGGFSWPTAIVWFPISLVGAMGGIGLSIALSYGVYYLTLCYPQQNKFKKIAPRIVLMSVISGISNMLLIVLISSSLNSSIPVGYLVFYYLLTFVTYFLGRRFVQTSLIKFSRGVVYEIRLKLFDKLFSTSYQRFEKLDIGRIYTALNEDVGTIGESTNTIVTLMTSLFTAGGAFLYLSSIAFWATLLTFLLIGALSGIYYFVSRSTNKYFQQARDTRNDFVRLTSGMIDGFKELSLHRNKKQEYKQDIGNSADQYRIKISTALTRFVNASLIGESLLIILLGAVAFAIPKVFPGIEISRLMSFVIVLLYLMGPINSVLSSVPAVMQLKIAWDRIRQFLQQIPANEDPAAVPAVVDRHFERMEVRGICYQHGHKSGDGFAIGPIDLEVRRGEILFIVGGNGSGKTTLAKLITGLYEVDKGKVFINGRQVPSAQLGEYYSAVFSPVCLFEKLYDIDCSGKTAEIARYLKVLDLDHKVTISGNRYSTVQLSGGQRKRLALLQCYLEDRPIYLFDEWAADQDPTYRNFFYRTLLPEMKKTGKAIIAITHDDHYFDVADRVLKMSQGKLEALDNAMATLF